MLATKDLYRIANGCKLWEGELPLNWGELPWVMDGSGAYILFHRDEVVLYRARTVTIQGKQYPRIDRQPWKVRTWKNLETFRRLCDKWNG